MAISTTPKKTSASTETESHQLKPWAHPAYAKNQPEHTENQPGKQAPPHPLVHTTSTYQRPLACSGQKNAKAAHTDKCRRAKPTGQPSVQPGGTRSPPPSDMNMPQRNQPIHPPENPETPKQTQNIPMTKVPSSQYVRESQK